MHDTIAFIVRLPARGDQAAALERELMPLLEAMAHEEDFVSAHLHQPPDDPDTFVLYETWACSREHFLAHHLGRPYRAAFEVALPSRLRAQRSIEFLDLKRHWHRPVAGGA